MDAALARPHKSPLIRLFRAARWRIVFGLAPPVTPEVAGSSPVAPVFEVPARGDFFVAGFREQAVLGQQ